MRRAALMLTLSACANRVERWSLGEVEVVTFRAHYNNAHLIRAPEGDWLFDAGLEADAPDLVAALAAEGVRANDLAMVLVSHGHADHAGGAAYLQREHGVPVLMGEADLPLAEAGENDHLCPTNATAERRREAAQAEAYTPFTPDLTVGPEASLDLAAWGGRGVVYSLPGHTPGSLVLDLGPAVLVGDLVRGKPIGGGAARHYYQCDLADNDADLRTLLHSLTPQGETYFVGHFGPLSRDTLERFVATLPAPRQDH